jgi:hypothetical protein
LSYKIIRKDIENLVIYEKVKLIEKDSLPQTWALVLVWKSVIEKVVPVFGFKNF